MASSSNTTESLSSVNGNEPISSVPGRVRPRSHRSPFGSLSALSCAAAMTFAGDGVT